MNMTDGELLRRYAQDHSETAFEELVRRHINLVYSAALRQTHTHPSRPTRLEPDPSPTVDKAMHIKVTVPSDPPGGNLDAGVV